jgi:transposase
LSKLSERELVCAEVLVGKGRSLRQVAKELGVDESTLRYRLGRRRAGAVDGRSKQSEACAPFEDTIRKWMEAQDGSGQGERPASVRGLYDDLVRDHGFSGSYKSVVRFVRRRAPAPSVRPSRRVESRPGAQAQADWATRKVFVHELGGVTPLQTFVMPLSHARFTTMRFYQDATMLSWLDAHNRAFEAFDGVPLTVRIDNLKTGVKRGAGAWAVLNDTYEAYAREVGFVVDPARPGKGSDKGKVERRVQEVVGSIVRPGERFVTLDDLNDAARERLLALSKTRRNPVTGTSIFDAWQAEREVLRPLPVPLPEPFDVQVVRPVGRDGLVAFEGRRYLAPYPLVGRSVQVRGAPGRVLLIANAHVVHAYPRGTPAELLIDNDCYEPNSGPVRAAMNALYGDAPPPAGAVPVLAPTPLGRIGRAITAGRSWEAAARPLSAYEDLVRRTRS